MSDLPISGVLDVTVDEASKRAAQKEIEEDLGHLSVGVDARSGGGRGGNVRGREQAMARRLASESNEIAESQLEELELIYERVDEIADTQGGGLLAGGGDGVLGLLTDVGGDAAGEVGGAGALTGAAAALSGAATALTGAATALGAGGAINGLSELIGGSSVTVAEPDWTPIGVENVGELSVEEPRLSVNDPSPLGVDDPSPLTVAPDYTAPLDPDYVAPIQDDPIPVEVSVSVDGGSGGSTDTPTSTPSSGRGDGASLTLPGFGVDPKGNLNISGGSITSRQDGMRSEIYGGKLHAGERGLQFDPPSFSSWETGSESTQSDSGTSGNGPTSVTVNVNQNTNVSADRNLRQDILSETESMVAEVQRELDRLRRDIRG